jgi:5'(3')-deoxyribonucleotidase
MKIAIDIDDVLADFSTEFIKFQKKKYSLDLEPIKDELYGVGWIDSSGLSRKEGYRRIIEFVGGDITKNLKRIKGSQKAVIKLKEKFNLVALTGRPASAKDVTKTWLNKNFPDIFSNLLITDMHMISDDKKDKGEICIENGLKLLIDDLPQYCLECASVDVPTLLFDQPHNQYFDDQEYSEITRVNSWESIVNKLI